MNSLDTTIIFKETYTKEYVPFKNNYSEINHDKDKWDKFCPICHYNYNSHYHKNKCKNQLPVGSGIVPLLLILLIYYFIKKYKSWKKQFILF